MVDKLTQVRLIKDGNMQVAWIPDYAAVEGYNVELKEENEFWIVDKVFNFSVNESVIDKNARNYLSHRKGTDI